MCMSCGFESILKVLAVSPTLNMLAEYKDLEKPRFIKYFNISFINGI